jgi:hypothetical protein
MGPWRKSAHQQFPSGLQVIGASQRAQRVSMVLIISAKTQRHKRIVGNVLGEADAIARLVAN